MAGYVIGGVLVVVACLAAVIIPQLVKLDKKKRRLLQQGDYFKAKRDYPRALASYREYLSLVLSREMVARCPDAEIMRMLLRRATPIFSKMKEIYGHLNLEFSIEPLSEIRKALRLSKGSTLEYQEKILDSCISRLLNFIDALPPPPPPDSTSRQWNPPAFPSELPKPPQDPELVISCPHIDCTKAVKVSPRAKGKRLPCPHCGRPIAIPGD